MAGGRDRNEATPAGRNGRPPTWEVQRQAISLRSAGATYRDIGQTLGIDHTWARRLVVDGIRENVAADVAEMREQEGARLDRLQRGLWQAATSGHVPSVLAVVRLMERRARLFGLDAPVRVEVSDEIDRQLEALAAQVGPMMIEGDTVYERPDPAP